MLNIMHQKKRRLLIALGIIAIISSGVVFRVSNLGVQTYWRDEVSTSRKVSGYVRSDVVDSVKVNEIFKIEKLRELHLAASPFQIAPTINSIIQDDPKHPPLHYLMLGFWTRVFGAEVSTIRSFSALFSILIIPLTYWFALEAFRDKDKALVSSLIVSVSPLQVMFAHDAKQYSLLLFLSILSCTFLLRALRVKKTGSWMAYSIVAILGLYTHINYFFVLISNLAFVCFTRVFLGKGKDSLKKFIFYNLLVFSAFTPWAIKILQHRAKDPSLGLGWMATSTPSITSLVKTVTLNITRAFFDIDFELSDWFSYLFIPIVLIMLFSVASFVKASKPLESFFANGKQNVDQKFWFLLIHAFMFPICFLPLDLFKGTHILLSLRYVVVNLFFIQIIVSWFITSSLQKKVGKLLLGFLLLVGLYSSFNLNRSEIWWNKYAGSNDIPIAKIINVTKNPLMLASTDEFDPHSMYGMSYSLDPEVSILYFNQDISRDALLSAIKTAREAGKEVFIRSSEPVLPGQLKDLGFSFDLSFSGLG